MIKKERRHLPDTRRSITHKAHIGAICELYLTVGLFEDGTPGELFIVIGKEGSELAGAYDAFGIAVSMLLQSGFSIEELTLKFGHTRSEPNGFTGNPDVPNAKSIPDYIFQWMTFMWGNKKAFLTFRTNEEQV